MQLNTPSNASPIQFYLLAVARGVSANALATTTLIWLNGASAANTIPMSGRVFGKSGTLALMVASIQLNSVAIQPVTAASSVLMGAGADPLVFPLGTTTSASVVPASGNWSIVVSTINGTAATVDCEIWGIRTS